MALQIPDLDDKRYADLVQGAVSRIPIRVPEWTDHNASDPGITLVELFAWLAEMQIYGLNYVRPEHYRKFLRLIGANPKPASPATVAMTFDPVSGWEGIIPAGTMISTAAHPALGEEGVPFETNSDLWVLDNRIEAVISAWGSGFLNHSEANAVDGIYYHAFGESPGVGSTLSVAFAGDLAPGREVRLTIDLYEADLPPPGSHRCGQKEVTSSVRLAWEYSTVSGFRALESTEDSTLELTRSGHILFTVPADMAAVASPYLPHARPIIRCVLAHGAWEIPPRVDALRINTVSAVQRQTVTDEQLFTPDNDEKGSGLPGQVFVMSRSPVLAGSVGLTVEAGGLTAVWHRVNDLDSSGPSDNHYVLNPQNGEIRFGDGMRGRALPKDATVRAGYRVSTGEKGNVKAGTVTELSAPISGIASVYNHAAASGGADAETLEEAIKRAPLELRRVDRAITNDDFEYLAMATPGIRVARAKAIPLWQPGTPEDVSVPAVVTVVVVPWSFTPRPYPGQGFLKTVCRHLDRHRLVTTRLGVIPPSYVEVSARVRLYAADGYSSADVRGRVVARLLAFLHPLTGGGGGQGWPFGRAIYRSEVIEAVKGVEGVDCVVETILSGDRGARPDGSGNLLVEKDALVWSLRHEVEVTVSGRCGRQS